MKVAVTTRGKDLKSLIDPHFGRARYFIVVDSKSGEFTVHDNAKNADAAHGAGIQAAGAVIDSDARPGGEETLGDKDPGRSEVPHVTSLEVAVELPNMGVA
jgi:hypothetical protein